MTTKAMESRQLLHRLVDALPERDLSTAKRVLEALRVLGDPVAGALRNAPIDDEPGENGDEGLAEARRQADDGDVVSHEEAKAILGLA